MKRKAMKPQARGGVKAKDKHPVRLDNDTVRKLAPPKAGAVTVWDDDAKLSGFGLRLYSSGARSFFLNYWFDGRERRYTIGPFPRWSVAAARERAMELRREIDRGHDPAGEKRERREAPTVQDLIDRYITEHMPTKTGGPYRIADEKKMLGLIGEALGKHEKVANIHGGDIKEMHRRITETRGPVRANRILAVASKMFSLSLVPMAGESRPWRDNAMGNPCKGIAHNREEGRDRFFGKQELERIAEALAEYPGSASDVVRLIMVTGCRPGEALRAEWSEFDREAGYWIKAGARTKQRTVHKAPLGAAALELIERLRKTRRKDAKFVFPGNKPDEPLKQVAHVWRFVCERAQLAPDERGRRARPYDLRHTFASVGVGGGLSLQIVGKLLGHSTTRMTEKYAHLNDDPLREAANRISAEIAGGESAEVVPLHKRPQP
jgi:integrase